MAAMRLESRAGSLGVLAACVALSLALNFPYLFSGYQADDLIFLALRQRDPLPYSRWTGLWAAPFSAIDGFQALWWAAPDVNGAFFRPLPSLVIEAGMAAFGTHALPLHLLGIVLHGCVAASAYALLARLGGERRLALLAALCFLACEDHSMGVGWIATVTDLLCALFVNLALLAHLRRRAGGGWSSLGVSLGCLLAALASKESAALAPIAVFLLEVLFPATLPATAPVALRPRALFRHALSRARWWGPSALVMVVYLAWYRAAGFGVSGLMYLNPMTQPVAYVKNVLLGLPVMVLAAVTPVPPSLVMFLPETGPGLAGTGLLVLVVLALSLRPVAREPLVAWCTALFFVALLPQLATLPSERLLYLPMVFGCLVLARLIATLPWVGRLVLSAPAPRAPWLTRLTAASVGVSALLCGLILSAAYPPLFRRSLDAPADEVRTAVPAVRAAAPERVVITNTSGSFLTFYVADVLSYAVGRRIPVTLLSSANVPFELERVDARTLILRTPERGWISHVFANLVRTEATVVPGSRWPRPGVTAIVEAVTADGLDALAVRFTFDEPLDGERTLLLEWDGARFAPLDFAALRDGERRALARPKSLAAQMMGE